jgi:hypothetical protein
VTGMVVQSAIPVVVTAHAPDQQPDQQPVQQPVHAT